MPITLLPEDHQNEKISGYNQGKPSHRRIPLVPRNINTGWPLLQVSLFTAAETSGETRYEPALGGGNCHFIDIGHFMFACLLAKVPGAIKMISRHGYTDGVIRTRENITANNIQIFLEGFTFSHHCGISLSTADDKGYGKRPTASWNGEENSELLSILINPDIGNVFTFGTYKAESRTEQEIKSRLNHKLAIFENGQIFVDLGQLLDGMKGNEDLKDFLKNLFKVDEFNRLNPYWSNPKISKLYEQIDKLDNYGKEIASTSHKGNKIQALAIELKRKVDDFLKKSQGNKPTENDLIVFNQEFRTLLHSEDKVMREHRKIYNPIILNILLAAIGVGLILIPIKCIAHLIYSKINNVDVTINGALFFAKTKSTEKIEAIEDSLLEPETLITAA